MLLSMTGHGEAYLQQDGVTVSVEVRTLNSRYFKLTVRAGEGYIPLEPRIEQIVRQHVRRGTIQVNVAVDRQPTADDYRLNTAVLTGYREQLDRLCDRLGVPESVHLEALLGLPGVVVEGETSKAYAERDWPIARRALEMALQNLDQMRRREGRAMQSDLESHCETVLGELDRIVALAPTVAEAYRERLTERLNKLLSEIGTRVEPADVVREVGMFAERSDISEESVRLRSHVQQFRKIMELPETSGRKLDFLTQEMFREANTIGAKANNAQIAGHVVEIKASIERMREMVQNVE